MHLMRRITASLSIVTAIAIFTSCSPNGSGNINGPADNLNREPVIIKSPEVIAQCKVVPNNIFMDDTALPFIVDCEDMNEVIHTVYYEHTNGNGCVMETRGRLSFPSTGNAYVYTATRDRCTPANASMTVCGPTLGQCVTLALPVPTQFDVNHIPGGMK
ncbi:MAG: hypothetical protein GF341_06335 [candidate division Zixibacteria bacterium]|nr:hypothetical protein [candidate division Zixibacteria bacterium]